MLQSLLTLPRLLSGQEELPTAGTAISLASPGLVSHPLTLSFADPVLEGEYLAEVAKRRWPVLLFILCFDISCFLFRITAKCIQLLLVTKPADLLRRLADMAREFLPQLANMALLYVFLGLLNRRSRRLGDKAARQEEVLLSACMALAICGLLSSLSADNCGDYVYVAFFLICTSTFLKLRWYVGTAIQAVPAALMQYAVLSGGGLLPWGCAEGAWAERAAGGAPLPGAAADGGAAAAGGAEGALAAAAAAVAAAAAAAPPAASLASLLRPDAAVHVAVAWAVGGLMAYLADWYRRQMYAHGKLAALALSSELTEAQARIAAQRALAAAQAQAAQRALSVAREKAANEAKSEFMSLMCHEVRTPLNGCLASAEMLLETQLLAEQRELAATIRVSGSILLSTVSNFLDFFKLEAGKALDVVRSRTNLRHTVADVHCIIEAMIGRGGDVALLPPDMQGLLWHVVYCDADRVRGILLNLYTNAAKFTKAGHIQLRVREVPPHYAPDAAQAAGWSAIVVAPASHQPPQQQQQQRRYSHARASSRQQQQQQQQDARQPGSPRRHSGGGAAGTARGGPGAEAQPSASRQAATRHTHAAAAAAPDPGSKPAALPSAQGGGASASASGSRRPAAPPLAAAAAAVPLMARGDSAQASAQSVSPWPSSDADADADADEFCDILEEEPAEAAAAAAEADVEVLEPLDAGAAAASASASATATETATASTSSAAAAAPARWSSGAASPERSASASASASPFAARQMGGSSGGGGGGGGGMGPGQARAAGASGGGDGGAAGGEGGSGGSGSSEEGVRWLLFEVADTGIGITPEGLKALFREYVQGTEDEMRKPRSKGGTGLGLSICSKQVGVLGGRIGAYSRQGHGSVFWFTIPVADAPPSEAAPTPSASASALASAAVSDALGLAAAGLHSASAEYASGALLGNGNSNSSGAHAQAHAHAAPEQEPGRSSAGLPAAAAVAAARASASSLDDGGSEQGVWEGLKWRPLPGPADAPGARRGEGGPLLPPSSAERLWHRPALPAGAAAAAAATPGAAACGAGGAAGGRHPPAASSRQAGPSGEAGAGTAMPASGGSSAGAGPGLGAPVCASCDGATCGGDSARHSCSHAATAGGLEPAGDGCARTSAGAAAAVGAHACDCASPAAAAACGATPPADAAPSAAAPPLLLATAPAALPGGTGALGSAGLEPPVVRPVLAAPLSDGNCAGSVGGGGGDTRSLVGRRALLVEDNLINRTVARKMLASLGLHCDVASNGLEALQAVEAALRREDADADAAPDGAAANGEAPGTTTTTTVINATAAATPSGAISARTSGGGGGGLCFDIILMDMAMPVMGGVDATRAIRRLGCGVPILAMTANASDRDRDECRAAGMDGFLSKPVLKDRLAEALARVLDGCGW